MKCLEKKKKIKGNHVSCATHFVHKSYRLRDIQYTYTALTLYSELNTQEFRGNDESESARNVGLCLHFLTCSPCYLPSFKL